MAQGRKSRIVIDVDRVRAEAQAKRGRSVVGRAGRVLGVTGLVVVAALLVLLVGSYMWYQGFKKSPPYSLALLLRSEEHTSELQSRQYLVCRLLLEKKKQSDQMNITTLPPLCSLT